MKDYKLELTEDELKVLAGVLGEYIAKNEHNEEVKELFETVRNIFKKVIKAEETHSNLLLEKETQIGEGRKITDEELAKEYEEKAEYIELDDYGKKRYDSMDIQQAFLAGLKVGRPQLHDLRKDPTDLPEKCTTSNRISKCVIGVIEHWADNRYRSKECYYNFVEKKWADHIDPYVPNVVAWCELPTFDKEGLNATPISNYPIRDDQLIKAKMLIKEMLPYMPKENIEGVYEIVTHAEEFIKE